MSGIAGYVGLEAEGLDGSSVAHALSFTGVERVEETRRESFLGIAVNHEAETSRCPPIYEEDGFCILLDGYISEIDGKSIIPLDPGEVLRNCLELFRSEGITFARRLNGSFSLVICEPEKERLHLVSDRLATRPLYYVRGKGLFAFASRLEAFFSMGLDVARRLNEEALLEFLAFGHLLDADPWPDVREVPAGTLVSLLGLETMKHSYWRLRFSYDRNTLALEDNAERLVGILRKAVGRCLKGCDRVGLLLSGGLDSRALLACLPDRTVCYTSCDGRNFEARTAAKAASTRACRHIKLLRSPQHYLDILPEAARMGEGFLEYYHAHLGGLYRDMEEVSGGVVFAGNGLDIILREPYLPRVEKRIGGRVFSLPVLQRYRSEAEVVEGLLRPAYILTDGSGVLAAGPREGLASYPREAMQAFVEKNSSIAIDLIDVCNFVVLRSISRWITSPNITCVRHCFSERVPAFDTELVDLALSIPPQQRFGSRVFVRALRKLNPRLAMIADSNTFLPGCAPGMLRDAGAVPSYLYNRLYKPLARRTWRHSAPPWLLTTGSWPNLGAFWTYGPISVRLEELLRDDAAMRDGLIAPDKVAGLISEQKSRAGNHFYMLSRLISFLEWRSTCP